jgi:hypothetical protein
MTTAMSTPANTRTHLDSLFSLPVTSLIFDCNANSCPKEVNLAHNNAAARDSGDDSSGGYANEKPSSTRNEIAAIVAQLSLRLHDENRDALIIENFKE